MNTNATLLLSRTPVPHMANRVVKWSRVQTAMGHGTMEGSRPDHLTTAWLDAAVKVGPTPPTRTHSPGPQKQAKRIAEKREKKREGRGRQGIGRPHRTPTRRSSSLASCRRRRHHCSASDCCRLSSRGGWGGGCMATGSVVAPPPSLAGGGRGLRRRGVLHRRLAASPMWALWFDFFALFCVGFVWCYAPPVPGPSSLQRIAFISCWLWSRGNWGNEEITWVVKKEIKEV